MNNSEYKLLSIRFHAIELGIIRFYDVGYEDGFKHGHIHGRIEGRELGRQKGFEMWEELGFYEGFANLWKTACENNDGY